VAAAGGTTLDTCIKLAREQSTKAVSVLRGIFRGAVVLFTDIILIVAAVQRGE
jgi:hypothetical protein